MSPPAPRYPSYRRRDGVVVQPVPLSCPQGDWYELVGFQHKYAYCGNPEHGPHQGWRCNHCGETLWDPPCDLDGKGLKAG